MRRTPWRGIVFLLWSAFLLSSAVLLLYGRQTHRETAAFAELAELITAEPAPSLAAAVTAEPETVPTEAPLDGFALLQTQNPALWGWLSIEGTDISYPVMHTPDEPEYYLHRDFQGAYSFHGTPFLDGSCTETYLHALIYGHNMRDGALFAPLLAYASEDFWQAHPTVCLRTAAGVTSYRVLAAFYARVCYPSETDVFRYYQYTDLSDPQRFAEYVEQVSAAALYDTHLSADYGNRLLTLSTCSYHTQNGRFAVVAVEEKNSSPTPP